MPYADQPDANPEISLVFCKTLKNFENVSSLIGGGYVGATSAGDSALECADVHLSQTEMYFCMI